MAIRRTTISALNAAGGAGVATISGVSAYPVEGIVYAIHLAYQDSPPAGTTDVTIAEKNNSPAAPILTVTNGATDGWHYPMAQAENQAAAAITGMGLPIVVADYINVTIAQANNGDGVIATLIWDDCH